jgi:hypothetical protein
MTINAQTTPRELAELILSEPERDVEKAAKMIRQLIDARDTYWIEYSSEQRRSSSQYDCGRRR